MAAGSPLFKNTSRAVNFIAGNSNTYQLLYTPGAMSGVDLSGYIIDFSVEADITSVAELTPPVASALATRAEQAQAYYEIAKLNPSKRFVIYFEYPDNPGVKIRRAIALLWNRRPYFTLDLIPRFTRRNSLLVGVGVKIWGRFEDDAETAWNGELQGTDTAVVTVGASEEAPASDAFDVKDPEILTLTLTQADTQYPLSIPDGTRRFYLKCRGDASDQIADFRYAWASGIVANRTGNYEVVPASAEDGESGVWLVGKSLYLASSTPGVAVVMRVWK